VDARHGGETIALSGLGDHRKSQEAGFDPHLVKPVDIEALTRLLVTLPRARNAGSRSVEMKG